MYVCVFGGQYLVEGRVSDLVSEWVREVSRPRCKALLGDTRAHTYTLWGTFLDTLRFCFLDWVCFDFDFGVFYFFFSYVVLIDEAIQFTKSISETKELWLRYHTELMEELILNEHCKWETAAGEMNSKKTPVSVYIERVFVTYFYIQYVGDRERERVRVLE